MDDSDNARLIENGPVSKDPSSDDRLALLPKELRDAIYCLVFSSDNGPWTLHIKAKTYPSTNLHGPDLDNVLSILALPREPRYKAHRRQNPNAKWPDYIEGAFMKGLDWAVHSLVQSGKSKNEVISEIIYELTGARRCRKNVSSHRQVLKQRRYDMEPKSKHILTEVLDSISKLRSLKPLDDFLTIAETIEDLEENRLPQLLEAFRGESLAAELESPRPILDFSSSPAITPNAEIFRKLSSIASDPDSNHVLSLSIPTSSDHSILSLTLVNRFHRTHALAILAKSLAYDFGDKIASIYMLHQSRTTLNRVRFTFVEGYMRVPFVEHVALGTVTVLPNLREFFVELWPRDPTRSNENDRSWGEQTVRLLEALRGVKARVVLELRWESDCQRFEHEYVGVKGWRIRESEGEAVDVMKGGEGMCRRSYELKGR
ncbi:MAG: hypothetical protein Q9161_002004 [Pseudevernia consocians]